MKKMKKVARTLFLLAFCLMLSQVPAQAASSTVAKIGNKSYSSLKKAFSAVKNGQTIKLQKNVKIAKNGGTISAKNVTLDLNGHTLKPGSYTYTVTYTSSDGTKEKVKYKADTWLSVDSGASVTIKNGTVNTEVYNSGKLTIASGTYKKAVHNYGTMVVKKGTINNIIWNDSAKSKITINKGTFGTLYNSGKATINGGTFKGYNDGSTTYHAIINRCLSSAGNMTINDMNAQATVYNAGGAKMVINGGTYVLDDTAVLNSESTLTINGGTFTYTGTGGGYAVMAGDYWDSDDPGKMKINGGTFSATTKGGGLRINGETVTVSGGSFSGAGLENEQAVSLGMTTTKVYYAGIVVYTSRSALTISNSVSSATTVRYYFS